MGDPSNAGGGGRNNNNLTTAFSPPEPDREPERRTSYEFEAAAVTDDQAQQMEQHLRQLESERAKLTAHLDHTPGGPVEQAVHENVSMDREQQIASLQERLTRRRSRGMRQ